jgi:hypothetical protein
VTKAVRFIRGIYDPDDDGEEEGSHMTLMKDKSKVSK